MKKTKRITSLILCVVMFLSAFVSLVTTKEDVSAATTNQKNIVARADYMYNTTWVCKKTIKGWNNRYTFYEGKTYHLPYAWPVTSGAYIGYGVSVENFVKAAANRNHAFYKYRSYLSGVGYSYSTYYGSDCSSFVSWCWGIKRNTTYTIPNFSKYIGGVTKNNSKYALQLGDALNSKNHVVLVTDLVYNSSGAITLIEITEQTPPQMKRSYYTPEALSAKYGGSYSIYRYYGNVPAAPGKSTGSTTTTTTNKITTKYFPKCGSSYTSFYPAMESIGVSCSWDLHCKIAEKNGITGFKGTVAQNTQLLNLLKQGKLLNPDYVDSSKYYPKCGSSYTSFYPAMESIGITCSWDLHCKIAKANGITGFTGTAAQNTQLLNLLKQGKLLKPGETTVSNDYYPACASSYTTFYAAMESIGVSCDWELHKQIAKVNGITNFTGTAAQNTQLLNLLRQGKLIKPKGEVSNNQSNVESPTTTPGGTSSSNPTTTPGGTSSSNPTTTPGGTSSSNPTTTPGGTSSNNSGNSNTGTSKVVLDNIVVGINEKYIGEGYEKLISSAFSTYLAKTNYKFNIEYRTLGDSQTTAAQLGSLINSSKDIDFVLAAGANIQTQGGVDIVTKAKLISEYNSDGKRYGALINDTMSAVLFYNFVTGENLHYYDNDNDATCNICAEERSEYTGVALKNGVNVNFIKGYDTQASNTPVISGTNSIVFTADTDSKDEVWEIDLGDNKLSPNKRYTVQFALKNSVGNVGVGCVRDEYISEIYGVNTFYGNYTDKTLASSKGYNIRERRGFYEISDIVDGKRKSFPYSVAYVDADGYVKLKLDVAYNGTTYVSNLYYMNKSSEWVKLDEAYVGVSSSNNFGLYVLHGSTSKSVAAIKDVKYSIEDSKTSYSKDVATPTIKLIDYNVQTGNTYYTATANWLKSQSPDIIGLQEVGPNWYKSLKNLLGSTYGYVGTPRSGTSSTSGGNEASPIFYKKSEYSLIESGTKWLSSTPDKVGSRISGSEYVRVMTYVVLYHKDTGTIYTYVNTHLDNADDGSVRVKQINILMDIVDDLPNYPTILTGDLNGGLNSQVITKIQNGYGYTSLARKAATKTSSYNTNTFWETSSPTVLDYIFLSDMNKFNALSYMVGNNSSRCSVYKRSDHYPLVSTFSLK